jgi:ribosomal protein S18 acetylase RimI-like enzyme
MMYDFCEHSDVTEDLADKLQSILEDRNVDIEPYEKKPYAISITDGDQVIGGVTGYSVWNWFYVSLIGVDATHQGNGFGKKLLSMVEEEALKRKCCGIWLHTMSFQAPEFYENNGFQVFGDMDDCPIEHKRIFYKKNLKVS